MKGEDLQQYYLIKWCEENKEKYKELDLIYSIPNGGYRHPAEARKLKLTGLKSGVPDLFLPVAKGEYHGLYIEMKWGKNKTTENQNKWIEKLKKQGYRVDICYGSEKAIEVIKEYLEIKSMEE